MSVLITALCSVTVCSIGKQKSLPVAGEVTNFLLLLGGMAEWLNHVALQAGQVARARRLLRTAE